ncbi:MAG: hypothetical protein ABI588_03510 [Arenimonas sp.]
MLCARATLTAGPRHQRYSRGATVRAVIFAQVGSPDELQVDSFKSLKKRGWAKMSIDGYATLADDHAFPLPHSPEAEAFRAALESGIGIVVLGLVQ